MSQEKALRTIRCLRCVKHEITLHPSTTHFGAVKILGALGVFALKHFTNRRFSILIMYSDEILTPNNPLRDI